MDFRGNQPVRVRGAVIRWLWVACLCCGSTPAFAQLHHFQVEVFNSPATAGTPVTIRLTAQTILNLPIPLFNPTSDITMSLTGATGVFSNPSGSFSLSEGGVLNALGLNAFDLLGQFTCQVTCNTAGTFSLSVSDGLVGGSGSATWSAGSAHRLIFDIQPGSIEVGAILTPAVRIVDAFGNTVAGDSRMISLTLSANPGGANLTGTTSLTSSAGMAIWSAAQSLSLSAGGTGYTLRAGHDGAAFSGTDVADSAVFNVNFASSNGNENSNSSDNANSNGGSNTNTNTNSNSNSNTNTNGSNGNANGSDDGPTDDTDGDGIPDPVDPQPNDPDSNDDGTTDGEQTDSDGDGVSDANDNCPTLANGAQTDADGNQVGDVCEDDDGDGVFNVYENAGPNGGDANGDGIPDSQQPNVSTLLDGSGGFVTLVAPPGTRLRKVRLLANPSPANSPNADFPVGFIGFTLADLPTGGVTTDLQMTYGWADGTVVNSYYNFGPEPDNGTPHWYGFLDDGDSGATIQGNVITLRLIDGGRGDDDLNANQEISAVGGPALSPDEVTNCGGPLCGPVGNSLFGLTMVTLAGAKVARRRTVIARPQ